MGFWYRLPASTSLNFEDPDAQQQEIEVRINSDQLLQVALQRFYSPWSFVASCGLRCAGLLPERAELHPVRVLAPDQCGSDRTC